MSSAANPNARRITSVLVVDDDVELAMMYKELLGSQGYIVNTAPNGVEALKLLMRLEVDAVICDMMMPHMPGDMFYLAVERVKPHLCQRFIFVTSYEGNPKIEAFFKKVNGIVLYKPTTLGKLMGTLNLLNQRLANADKQPSGAG
ncbi:MAG: response regulator [Verrucomicrobia bacterium]|nr:response regulator [Verrucomicrobiota bacterium]NBU08464.1 response regulator [Pseudomonadota bacterium]NDA65210.1 response regulator [Verrucomicrobiota bacterium]NDE97383.1 response regulator [Verrucomicrobiota bacterium]